jgi:trimeric autotransporter adhesin
VAATAAVAAATVEAHLCLACFSEAMAAAESLLTRQTVSCLRDREIGFLLGSLSPALQAAAAHSTNTSSSSSSSSDSTTAAATAAAAAAAAAAASVLLHSARLAGALLRHYAKKVKCAAAPLIALLRSQLRLLFALLAAPAASDHTDGNSISSSEHSCSAGAAAAAVSRLLEALLPHKEVFKHYAPALLAEYVLLSVHSSNSSSNSSSSSSSSSGSAAAAAKQALLTGIFCLIDACGPGEIQQLHSALDATGRALFQVLYGDYQRRHKYAGRI